MDSYHESMKIQYALVAICVSFGAVICAYADRPVLELGLIDYEHYQYCSLTCGGHGYDYDIIVYEIVYRNNSVERTNLQSVDFRINSFPEHLKSGDRDYIRHGEHFHEFAHGTIRGYTDISKNDLHEMCPWWSIDVKPYSEGEITLCFVIANHNQVAHTPKFLALEAGPFNQYTNIDAPCFSSESEIICEGQFWTGNPLGFQYIIYDADYYDKFQPNYSTLMLESIEAGLEAWAEAQTIKNEQPLTFELVNDTEVADFYIFMGGTGENNWYNLDILGEVDNIGCLAQGNHADSCTITLYLEDEEGELFNADMIKFVMAHEFGHLLGFPHHSSVFHVMYSPLDPSGHFYNDADYGFIAPDVSIPEEYNIAIDSESDSAPKTTQSSTTIDDLRVQYESISQHITDPATKAAALDAILQQIFQLLD